jgi:starch synthase (maltosyl-transferring)
MERSDGRLRVVFTGVRPEIDCGRHPVRRIAGDTVTVEADAFAEGHDRIACVLRYRKDGATDWHEVPMEPLGNDRWRASFVAAEIGRYRYTIEAWIDRAGTWHEDLSKKHAAGQDEKRLRESTRVLAGEAPAADRIAAALDEEILGIARRHPDRRFSTHFDRELVVEVDPPRARFSSWYEIFPRSASPTPGKHGTFRDCEALLPSIAEMGFDVLYFPPVHPIGRTNRKGRNNAPLAAPGDPGSPWAIGSEKGGHTAVHPELGTLEDFERLVATARRMGIEIALDLAFQCSPDHPWAKEHPQWFRHRPDGSIQHAENPPKKYEDIYALDFESEDWRSLWEELRRVVEFWIGAGVRIFRVDNPHTKPFRFWEWLLAEIRGKHPETLFLSEAFTRPKVMYQLAKIGFTHSYTYFTWRHTKAEIEAYFRELYETEVREFFRPHLWPNTPDILTESLQTGGRAAFMARLVLAATLSANYGIYGPAFELCESRARHEGSEEYLDSEKYELRRWDRARPDSLRDFVATVNRIRRECPSLQRDGGLAFHPIENEQLIAYSRVKADRSDVVVVVVSLDPHHGQSGWLQLRHEELGLDPAQPYLMHDLLCDARFLWRGRRNLVEIQSSVCPARIYRMRRRVRSERDFDYYF